MPIAFSANTFETFVRMPIREKSSSPHMRKAFQPSSLTMILSGTIFVGQTRDFSWSLLPENTNG